MMRWLVVVVALAACGGKRDERRDPAAVEPRPVGPAEAYPDDGLPHECHAYSDTVAGLVACEKLPRPWRALWQRDLEARKMNWKVQGDNKRMFGTMCARDNEALQEYVRMCKDPTVPAPTTGGPVPAETDDLPRECRDYVDLIARLAHCKELPQATRDALQQTVEQTKTAWASIPAAGRAPLGSACANAAAALGKSMPACATAEVEKQLTTVEELGQRLPAACHEYTAAIIAFVKCEKVPQAARDALRQSYEVVSADWVHVPAEGMAALGIACKSAADAVKQSSAACN